MITIRLCGGLGNQLFQWALGVALESRGNQVQFDTTLLDQDRGRRYLLGDLGLKLNLTKENAPVTVQEKSLRFDPAILELKGDQVLNGYWQSEKYFASVGDHIRRTLFRKTVLSRKTLELAQQIKELRERSCFVHVRRSDNLRPTSTMYHGLTNPNDSLYYGRSLAAVLKKSPDSQFFLFSDDAEWCAAKFKSDLVTVVSHNAPSFTVNENHDLTKTDAGREVEDLWLMSLCQHGIIANSTFSWWGAFLNSSKEPRTVIAPDPWFSAGDLDAADIIPDRWTKVSTR
jgi:hypothetical protein